MKITLCVPLCIAGRCDILKKEHEPYTHCSTVASLAQGECDSEWDVQFAGGQEKSSIAQRRWVQALRIGGDTGILLVESQSGSIRDMVMLKRERLAHSALLSVTS